MPITINGDGTITGANLAFESHAVVIDQKSSGTNGGTATAGDWRKRDLNTILFDPDNIVTVSNNEFTLDAGTYRVRAEAPAYNVNKHAIKLTNVTDSTDIQQGRSQHAAQAPSATDAFLIARFTLTGTKSLAIYHRVLTTGTGNGFGVNFGLGDKEIYTVVEIFKELV